MACFANVAAHLAPGGAFVMEVMVPGLQRLPPGETSRRSPSPRPIWVSRSSTWPSRGRSPTTTGCDGTFETFSAPFRYVWPSELDLMARLAGMTLRERWNDWHRSPFTSESRSHVSVWEKATEGTGPRAHLDDRHGVPVRVEHGRLAAGVPDHFHSGRADVPAAEFRQRRIEVGYREARQARAPPAPRPPRHRARPTRRGTTSPRPRRPRHRQAGRRVARRSPGPRSRPDTGTPAEGDLDVHGQEDALRSGPREEGGDKRVEREGVKGVVQVGRGRRGESNDPVVWASLEGEKWEGERRRPLTRLHSRSVAR